MKLVFLLFIYLIALSNCSTYPPKIEPDKEILLDTAGNQYKHFYIDASYFSKYDNIYIYFKSNSYNFQPSKLRYCFTDKNPESDLSTLIFYYKSSSVNIDTGSSGEYLYQFDYTLSKGKYLAIEYYGTPSASQRTLYVQVSSSDVHKLLATALSVVIIVLIVIGSIIVLSVVITILICCCICRRRTVGGQVGYVNPQPTYVVTNPNPVTYPLAPNGY